MQIFSILPTGSSLHRGAFSRLRGFTLIELLISIGIIGVVTGIVIVKYGSFDSSILLKSAAYDIALSLRDTQVKSVSVVRSTNFDYPYGMSFSPDSKIYTVFLYTSATAYPNNDLLGASPVAQKIQDLSFERTIQVVDVCVEYNSNEYCKLDPSRPVSRLDISFRRPEFKALFFVPGTFTQSESASISRAKIKLQSTNGGDIFIITVSQLGQISVSKQ